MSATTVMLTMLAGGLGAVARYLVDTAVTARVPSDHPWGITVVNVTGSFLLGVLTALAIDEVATPETAAVLGPGLLGGYTTFSTASLDTIRLAMDGRHAPAVANGVLQLLGCIAAAGLGLTAGHLAGT